MSQLLGIWGEVPDESQEWYENMQIPDATKRLGTRAFYFEAGENMFPEEHAQSATSFTLYDPLELADSQSIEQSLSAASSNSDALQNVLLEARSYTTPFEEKIKSFSGDYADIGCLVLGVFRLTPEIHDKFFEWWRGEFVPCLQSSPDFLRARLWKLGEAAELRDQTVQTQSRDDPFPYVTVYEFQSPDLPWEVVVEAGQSEAYQRFVEQDLQYKYGLYHLRRIYKETGEVEREFNSDACSDEAEEGSTYEEARSI